jgi:hypothetical protein
MGQIAEPTLFSRARNERFRDHDIFRQLFERVVARCIRTGLVGGEGFAVDASLIAADANKGRSIPGSEWNKDIDPIQAGRAVKAQQPAMPVVGFVNAGSADASAGYVAAFRKGLDENGYVEGQNVAIEYHWLEGQ